MVNMRNIAVGLIATAVVAFAFPNLFSFSLLQNEPGRTLPEGIETHPPEERAAPMLPVNYRYRNGMHIITGAISVPTHCHALLVSVDKIAGREAVISFTTRTRSVVCAQALAERTFYVSFQYPFDVRIRATLNGAPVTLVAVQDAPAR